MFINQASRLCLALLIIIMTEGFVIVQESILSNTLFILFCSNQLSTTDNRSKHLHYSKHVNHTVFCLRNGSENLLLGKLDNVLEVNDAGVVKVNIYQDYNNL